MTESRTSWSGVVFALVGLLPALPIILFLQLDEGQLVVAGQAMSEYDLARLVAGLLSTMGPLLLLAPAALAVGSAPDNLRGRLILWLQALLLPWLLLVPSVLAGSAVGGSISGAIVSALTLLSLLSFAWYLWLHLLTQILGARLGLLAYAVIWTAGGYLSYLSTYIAPYLELPVLNLAPLANAVLPQLTSGLAYIDGVLQGGDDSTVRLTATFIQIPVLLGLAEYLRRKRNMGISPESTVERSL